MTTSVSKAKLKEHTKFLDELWEVFTKRDRDWCKYEDYDGSYGEVADNIEDVVRTLNKFIAEAE